MAIIKKQGAAVFLGAVDAAGLPVAPITPASWSVIDGFRTAVADDSLSMQIFPADEAVSASGLLIVTTPDGLQVEAEVIYTAATVSKPARLTLTFADNVA